MLYATALQRILPTGVNVYVALLTTPPDSDGLNEGEASYAGYARIAHSAWATHLDAGSEWYLSNTGTIVFAAVTGSAIVVPAWGIYAGAVGGNLLLSGPMLNSISVAVAANLAVGDQARFLDDGLKIKTGT